MTEIAGPHVSNPRIMVLKVQPGTPPLRIVEIDGEPVGVATIVTDVLEAAAVFGVTVHDLDDPDVVRWVGGDKFTWLPPREDGVSRVSTSGWRRPCRSRSAAGCRWPSCCR